MGMEEEPWWLNLVLEGFEDDDSDDDDSDDEDEDEDEDEDDEEDDSDEDSDEDDEDEDDEDDEEDTHNLKDPNKGKKNIKGLKSALRKERMGHKKFKRLYEAERKKNKTSSKSEDKKDDKSSDKEPDKDTGPSERELKLAAQFKDKAIDAEILKWATKMKFIDPEDAVRLVKRSEIEFDQDEDDPTLIEIDEESVEDAVKTLAKKKRHLIATGSGRGRKTGSKFNGSGKGKGSLDDEVIRKKFGLNRSSM